MARAFYRNFVTIEVVSDHPLPGDIGILSLAREIQEESSGLITHEVQNQQISPNLVHELLIQHGNDPSFLLTDEEQEGLDPSY